MKACIKYFCAIVLNLSVLSGCSLYRVSVTQGREFSPQQIQELTQRLHAGLTRDQVLYIMGEPIMRDDFSPHRWDYVYFSKNSKGEVKRSKAISLFFNNNNIVTAIHEQ